MHQCIPQDRERRVDRRRMAGIFARGNKIRKQGSTSGNGEQQKQDERLQDMGKVLLEAPYRQQVTEEEVESLIGFCSDWIEGASPDKKSGLSGRKP